MFEAPGHPGHLQRPSLFYKVLAGSVVFHLLVLASMLFVFKPQAKRVFFSPVYTVKLVDPGALKPKPAPKKATPKKAPPPKPAKKPVPEKKVKVAKKPEPEPKPEPKPKPKPKPEPKPEPKKAEVAVKPEPEPEAKADVESAVEKLRQKVRKEEELKSVSERIEALKREKAAQREEVESSLEKLREELLAASTRETGDRGTSPEAGVTPRRAGTKFTRESLEAEYPEYYGEIHDRVWENWNYPVNLATEETSVIISIKIGRKGELLELAVEEGSGNRFFDESLVRAVEKSAPFPPLPEGFAADFLETGLRFCPGCTD